MNAFSISLVDLSTIMVYETEGPNHFPLFHAEIDRLREQLHGLGHELTWLGVGGHYAITPSSIWARKEIP